MNYTRKICLGPLVLVGVLSACSSYVQERRSEEFDPVYPEPPVETARAAPSGAIYSSQAPGLFAADRRAARIGDILTVEFSESFAAQDTQNTATTHSDSYAINLPDALGVGIMDANLSAGGERSFSGGGSMRQSNSLSGRLSVSVVRVLPGGNLEVVGQRRLSMTSGHEYVRLSGIVRPWDISSENVVLSDRIANAQIEYIGAGDVPDAGRQGWMRRTLNTISPF